MNKLTPDEFLEVQEECFRQGYFLDPSKKYSEDYQQGIACILGYAIPIWMACSFGELARKRKEQTG